ncbi:MAG: dTDP-4-dehydrorhamnose 3,5-epimerase [Magnetococcales bacterium]|nr:dTDP-4-dehydrorhamnose 3,5-epimerase [Magnetococcales bacterium]
MSMRVTPTELPEVLILEPKIYHDSRGFFFESFNQQQFIQAVGQDLSFVQDNQSRSTCGVLRGLHYQIQHPQGKLIRVLSGEIFDVAVDLRRSSPLCGRWIGTSLNAEEQRQLWIPPGFAHGFVVVSPTADILYKTTDYWYPKHERIILWNDPELQIDWPQAQTPILSGKDAAGLPFHVAELYP